MSTGIEAIDGVPSTATLRQEAAAFWRSRAPRERQALGAGLLALLAVLVWLLLVQPAASTVRSAPARLDQLERELQQIQGTAAEVKGLRTIAPVSSTQATAALKAATDRLGEHARLSMQGDRASLTLSGVDSEALLAWLVEARSAARARPTEASLTRAATGYSGTIVLTLGGVQ
jgi:general secretion pathway protein M